MRKARIGLRLSAGQLWVMSMAFRLGTKAPGFGFAPGLRNLLRYEARRVWHWLYERERLVMFGLRVGARLPRVLKVNGKTLSALRVGRPK